MKVTLAKDHTINGTPHKAGTTLEVPLSAEAAAAWQKRGIITAERGAQNAEPPKPQPPKAK